MGKSIIQSAAGKSFIKYETNVTADKKISIKRKRHRRSYFGLCLFLFFAFCEKLTTINEKSKEIIKRLMKIGNTFSLYLYIMYILRKCEKEELWNRNYWI